jgi:2-dehydropantoate 2-reductase
VRFVIYGAGAIGGVVGARLHQAGEDVVLIARGAHLDAIVERGLRLITPNEQATLRIRAVPGPREAEVGDGDVVLLTTKSQDTVGALLALREVAPAGVPVVLMQNGVENERVALRIFADVYGAVVMMPATHLEPGVVLSHTTRITGTLDIGRYPSGIDTLSQQVCKALTGARFESTALADVMVHKYAKLLNNLGNAVQAVCGPGQGSAELSERVRAEGHAVLTAAGIEHEAEDVSNANGRFERWGMAEIPGHPRGGGSTWQSVTRGTPIETDYLTGEIVLQARLHGTPAPLNELVQRLAHQTVREGHSPGWRTPESILAEADSLPAEAERSGSPAVHP